MEFIAAGPWVPLQATFLVTFICFLAVGFGGFLLPFFLPPSVPLTKTEENIFSFGLGISCLSLAILALGLLGKLYTAFVWGILAVFFTLPFVRRENKFRGSKIYEKKKISGQEKVFLAFVLFIILFSWAQATAPAIATDALSYHLFHAKQFVIHHRIAYVPFTRESLWPYQTEMLYTLSLLLQGTMLAQFFHWIFYVLTAAGVWSLAKRVTNPTAARLAALIFLLTPAAFAQSGVAYVDLSLAFFTLVAVYPLIIYHQSRHAGLVFLSGLFAGAACGTKYLGLGCALILFLLWAIETRFQAKTVIFFLSGCLAVGGIWYVRSWAVIGNPFYPFFPKYFGGYGFSFNIAENVGREGGWLGFLKLLWNMTLYPESFGGQMLGPIYLMFLPPLFLFMKKISRAAMTLILFSVIYTYFLYTQSQHLRFYLSVTPFLSIGAAYTASRFFEKRGPLKFSCVTVLLMAALLHSGIFLYRLQNIWPLFTGRLSATEYLEKHERSYRAYDYIAKHQKTGDHLFNAGEVRYFYSPDPQMSIDGLPLRQWLDSKNISLEDYLRQNRFAFILTSADTDADILRHIRQKPYQEVLSYEFYEKPTTFTFHLYQLIA